MGDKPEVKPGYKTTEFWVSILASVMGILVTTGVFDAGQAHQISDSVVKCGGALLTAISAGSYAYSRAVTKK